MAKFVVPLNFSLLQFQYQENISIIIKWKEYRQIIYLINFQTLCLILPLLLPGRGRHYPWVFCQWFSMKQTPQLLPLMLFLYCKTKLGVRAFKRSGHRTSPSKGSIIKHTTKTFQSQVIDPLWRSCCSTLNKLVSSSLLKVMVIEP